MAKLKIIKAPLSKREAATSFIAKMNAKEEHHIGQTGMKTLKLKK
ncbi:hypothetical protein ACQCT5_22450 [Sutcliffiella halmapala]